MLAFGSACGRAAPEARPSAAAPPATTAAAAVRFGIDVLMRDGSEALRGRRVGLLTNHTGRDSHGRSTIDLLHGHPDWRLVALFSPEHGIRGNLDVDVHESDTVDVRTGLPVYSLLGQRRKPTPAMLEGLDALVFDIQDVGARVYSYVWTMALSMQAAAESDVAFVVLDRPNPIGGELVQGNVTREGYTSLMGLYPVAMRHGMTVGEIARMINSEFGIGADLTVIPAEGWRRALWYDETGLPWVPPSPNMPSLESATHYPGTVLFEVVNMSVGRGTPIAFQQIGAPWLDHVAVVRALESYALPGVRYEAVEFTPQSPGDGKYAGEGLRGIRLVTTDRATYDPMRTAVAALIEIRRRHPDELRWLEVNRDLREGGPFIREAIQRGAALEQVTAGWERELAAFRALREPHLLYD